MADPATTEHTDILTEGEEGFDPADGELDLDAYLGSTTPPDKPSMMILADEDVLFPVAEHRDI